MTTWIGHQTKTFIFGFSNFISLPKILYILPFFCSKMFWYWHFLIVASIFKLLYVVKMGPVFTNSSFLHLKRNIENSFHLVTFIQKPTWFYMHSIKWYTITKVMLICIVIVLSLPSTWEVFLILLEFVKECVVKSPSKISIFADIPQNELMLELADTTSVRPKPLFWFRSDTETETLIGRYFRPIP